ncbi:MAG: serine hydrolase [Gemmatimonadetes bacterium]|nr:serine hydrolase [Gemmatimonadota bacterium]
MIWNIRASVQRVLLSALLAPLALGAQQPAAKAPSAAAPVFAKDRLARIDAVLDNYVTERRVGGVVALVLHDGKVEYEHAVGWSDREATRKMTADGIFRIASQTKAITSVAALILMEEGKLTLEDPVSNWIPTFAKTTVAVRTDTGRAIVPAKRAITIKDLLTHTSGVSYGTDALVAPLYEAKGLGPAAGFGWYTADKNEPICESMERLGTLPFVSQPGAAWVYGYNTDILGCVVERASGKPLDEFIRERITGPLGMTDTHFYLPPAKRDRLAVVYGSDNTGHAVRAPEGPRGQGDYVDGPRRSFAGGAGLLSTAHDYARFLEMIRRRGTLDGKRILAPHTVGLMTTNQVGTLAGDGMGWGLGFQITERYGASGSASVGTFGWGGAYGSNYKVDPAEGLVIVLMVNQLPNTSGIATKFSNLVYQALVGGAR